jgi:hypothetical protein
MPAPAKHPADRRFYATMSVVAGHEGAIAGLAVAFLLVGPAHDFATRRRIHPAYFGLLIAILIVPPVVLQLAGTDTWHAVAGWMMR